MDKEEANKVGTYGSIEAAESQEPAKREWHSYGSPLVLLLTSGANLAKQCVALSVILGSVMYSHEYLMSCDSRKVGFGMAAFCEYSKAYVRCFPLLALVVSLNVATRHILQHRLYYEMLKHGVLLDIENFFPLCDPIFQIVIWCAINAGAHFWVTITRKHGLGMDEHAQTEIKKIAAFYLVPTGLFLAFLYTAYDLEASLLPLSKYFEEDPAEARRMLGKMPFLDEPAAAAATSELNEQEAGPSVHLGEAVRQVTKIAEAKMQEAETNPDAVPPLSRWRLMGCLWPSEFLLHRNREDRESTSFRHAFYVIGLFCLMVILGVLFFFIRTTIDKVHDVGNHQPEDIFGLVVTFAHAWLTFILAVAVLKNITVPFRT